MFGGLVGSGKVRLFNEFIHLTSWDWTGLSVRQVVIRRVGFGKLRFDDFSQFQKNKALSARVKVICSNHKHYGGTLKGVDCSLASNESILNKIIIKIIIIKKVKFVSSFFYKRYPLFMVLVLFYFSIQTFFP